ncbi:MAG: hypothetical protein EOO38_03605 [Cytophagaceae bacterium]|nr:MAG: hypothetical protein EOO38_03605 [Cytophagaceae bacterium]
MSVREEYFVVGDTQPVIGTPSYSVPSRAIGQKLREIKLIRGTQVVDLPQILPEDITSISTGGQPTCFYLEGNKVVLYPYPSPSGTGDSLRLTYHLRHSKLVPSTSIATVTAVDTVTGVITTSGNPTAWAITDNFDIVSRSGESILRDMVPLAVSTNSITVAPSLALSEVTVGSYLSLSGETFVLQIPDDAMNLLAMMTVVECLNSMGSLQEVQVVQGKVNELSQTLTRLLTQRVIGSPKRRGPQV